MKINYLCLLALLIVFGACKKNNGDDDGPVTPAGPNYADSVKVGLWAHYNFDGNMQDLSGRNHNLTAVNGIKLGFDMRGNDNNALDFDGLNDYAVIDSGKVFPEGNFTISFDMMSKNTYGRPFQKGNFNDAKGASFGVGFDDVTNSNRLIFYVSKDDNICNAFSGTDNATLLNPTKVLYDYAWYHVVAVRIDALLKIYYNGVLVGSISTPNVNFKNCPNAPMYLGLWWLQDPHYFSGKMDNLRIYTRGLNDNEIKYLYDNEL